MAKRYFPPITALCEAIGTTPEALNKPGQISVPAGVLRYLIASALSDLEIDEEAYKDQNPDVAKAFARKPSTQLAVHYRTVGYFEQRPLPVKFDEGYYLRNNPDVEKAVKARSIPSARQHYDATGAFELRSPQADLETLTSEWMQILWASRKKP
jgi:hypothetical protein